MGKLSKQKAPNQILIKDFDWNSDWLYIVVVKKMFRYSNVFFYNHIIPQFCISEENYGKRYKNER